MLAALGCFGCGNSCFVGFFNSGNGGVIVKAGNPTPTCSLSQGTGTVSAVARKLPVCESCASAVRAKHIWVTIRSIQIRPNGTDDTSPADWVDLAPELANTPRQIDLMGNSEPVLLADSRIVPAGSYYQVRLEFFTGSNGNAKESTAENACGEPLWNCILLENGHVEPLHQAGKVPELVIPSQNIESHSLLVLPDARMEIRISLEPHQVVEFSSSEGWMPKTVLVGHAAFVRQESSETEIELEWPILR